ncbi:MAG: hypothetical protein GY910_28625, partial [bacterium]|nr:hypothetical protein [bacterium]
MMGLAPHVLSNLVVLALLVGLCGLTRWVRRRRIWLESAQAIWQRRRLAIVVIAAYLSIALLDSVAWVGGVPEGVADVLPNQSLSVLDRLFLDTREASYSAPFAGV